MSRLKLGVLIVALPLVFSPAARAQMGGPEYDVDRPGRDLRQFTAPNSTVCSSACAANPDCRAFTYVNATSTCWLKRAVPDGRPGTGMISGVRIMGTIETGVDRPGRDLRPGFPSANPAGCQRECQLDSRCEAWTWVRPAPQAGGDGVCWLKSTAPVPTNNACCDSGVRLLPNSARTPRAAVARGAGAVAATGAGAELTPPGAPLPFDPEPAGPLSPEFPRPTAGQMPFISASLTYDPDMCTAHLQPDGQNVLGSLVLCQPYPGFNIGPDGSNPQPYLVWSLLDNTCADGTGAACRPYSWWLAFAKAKGHPIRFIVEDIAVNASGGTEVHWNPVDQPSRTTWTISPAQVINPCQPGNTRRLAVRMAVGMEPDEGGSQTDYWSSSSSNSTSVPCLSAIADNVLIEVTFDTLRLSNVSDGLSDLDLPLEVGGDFIVGSSLDGKTVYANTALYTCANWQCSVDLTNGEYALASLPMCAQGWESCPYPFTTGNNTLLIRVYDGSDLELKVGLSDHDRGQYDFDKVCVTSRFTSSRSLVQWAATSNETVELEAHHDDADCKVTVVLNAVAR